MTNTTMIVASMIMATATTELRTNVTEQWHYPGSDIFAQTNMYYTYDRWKIGTVSLKDKWVITEIVRVKKLQFDWNGLRTIEDIQTVSKTTNHLKLVENWQPVPTTMDTNQFKQPSQTINLK